MSSTTMFRQGVYRGPFDFRSKDDIGFALARVHVNPACRKNAEAHNRAADTDDFNDPAFLPVQDNEYSAELHYGLHLVGGIKIQGHF